MNRLSIALLLASLLISQLAIMGVRRLLVEPVEVNRLDLKQIPMRLGRFTGQDVPTDETVQMVLNAGDSLSRKYTRPDGRTYRLHVARWANPDTISPAPHHPEVCYVAAGWTLLDRKPAKFDAEGQTVDCELILFERDGTRVVSLHWFVVGDLTFTAQSEFQQERHRFWGLAGWPDTVKFLLSTPAASIQAAEQGLLEFASLVYQSALIDPQTDTAERLIRDPAESFRERRTRGHNLHSPSFPPVQPSFLIHI